MNFSFKDFSVLMKYKQINDINFQTFDIVYTVERNTVIVFNLTKTKMANHRTLLEFQVMFTSDWLK